MFAIKNYPDKITDEELDLYLAHGWYRMGQTIFTTHFLCFGEHFYSALWIRLNLRDYQYSKSLRKVLRRCQEQLSPAYGEAVIDEEREELYQKYRQSFPGMIAPSLLDSLQDGENFNLYNTIEFTARNEKGELVAVSYFDAGKNSLSSILGFYDPDYKELSPGLFTMLMEIQYGLDRGFHYFYPGYVVPGNPRFDYKTRIGKVDYFDLRSNDWIPLDETALVETPLQRMRVKLEIFRQAALTERLDLPIQFYPLFEANIFGYPALPFFDYPILLYGGKTRNEDGHLVVVFDPRSSQYQLILCSNFDYAMFYFNDSFVNTYKPDRHFLELILVEEVLESNVEPGMIINALRNARKGRGK
jgi:leucyl-tRNA---protein transferase